MKKLVKVAAIKKKPRELQLILDKPLLQNITGLDENHTSFEGSDDVKKKEKFVKKAEPGLILPDI